jgi:hypothetical protein
MAVEAGYSKIATSGSVFIYDTGDTINSYAGEPTTNLLPYSQQFDSWGAGDVVVTANATYAPDGTLTADFFRANNIASYHYIYQVISISSSTTYTFSCYVKPAGGFNGNTNTFFMQTNDGSWKNITFNLSSLSYSATAGTTGYVQPLANGWYRVGWTIPIATGGSLYWYFYPTSAPSAETQGGGYYIWGAQLEQKSHMTQYLPTTTTSATRSNTQGLLDLSGNSNTITLANMSYDANAMMYFDGTDDYISNNNNIVHGTSEFSYFALVKLSGKPSLGTIFENGSWTSCLLIRYETNGITIYSMSNYWGKFSFDPPLNTWYYLGFVRRSNTLYFYVNGVNTASMNFTANISPSPNLYVGMSQHSAGQCFNGSINVTSIYTRALTDGEILSNFNHYKTRFNIT